MPKVRSPICKCGTRKERENASYCRACTNQKEREWKARRRSGLCGPREDSYAIASVPPPPPPGFSESDLVTGRPLL